jgi:L-lysine exporter family protein LysE/ArgO
MIHAFFYGIILAFGLIIPLGAQNIFVFNQGATQRHFLHAMPSVLTAACCDAVLIILAVLGISVAILAIPWLKAVVLILGFFFLLYMGWNTWKSKPTHLNDNQAPLSAKKQIIFSASASLLNPHALLDTIGVIGTSSLHFIGSAKWAYMLGCILMSCLWFFGLSVAGHFLHRLDKSGFGLIIINKLSALIIWAVALFMAWKIFTL